MCCMISSYLQLWFLIFSYCHKFVWMDLDERLVTRRQLQLSEKAGLSASGSGGGGCARRWKSATGMGMGIGAGSSSRAESCIAS
jgi:hypothetical protein